MIDSTDSGAGGAGTEAIGAAAIQASEATAALRGELEIAERAGRRFSSSLVSAFEGIAFKGKSLSDVFRSLTLSLSHTVLKAAFSPLEKGIGALVTGAVQGGFAFAKGGVFQRGGVVPFASGGVIASPIAFPLAGGMTGIAGERGAEAIVPLARGRDGRLGIAAPGNPTGNITINISTPDADSFRKSETQVAAMIARAAALGRRNL